MKKFKFISLMIAALSLGFGFTSCEEDLLNEDEEGGAATISIDASADKTQVEVGEDIVVSYDVLISDNKLESIELREGDNLIGAVQDGFDDTRRDAGEITYNATEAGDFVLSLYVVDNKGNSKTSDINITVLEAGGEISEFTAILMGAQSNTDEGSYLDANTGNTYMQSDAESNQSLIDVIYYYGSANKATFAAPNNELVDGTGANALSLTAAFSTKNATKFTKTTLDASDFDAIVNDATIVSEADGLSDSDATDVAVGEVVAFKTQGGKSGLIKVVELEAINTGTITIAVKVQN
jgi:hypothetical protein